MERNDVPGAEEFGGFGKGDGAGDTGENTRERLADVGSEARERASNARESLADALDSGADRLEQRGHHVSQDDGSMAYDGRMQHATTRLASGMHSTADWLRDHEMSDIREDIVRQVREHPGRSLLIAVGIGYLIGKAFRR